MIVLYWQIFKAIRLRAKKAASKKIHHGHGGAASGGTSVTAVSRDCATHKGQIPLVEARWNGAKDSLSKHRLSVAGLTGVGGGGAGGGPDGATNASSSFLVDDIEDIDGDDSGSPQNGGCPRYDHHADDDDRHGQWTK